MESLVLQQTQSRGYCIKQIVVPSQSTPGDYRLVKVYENGAVECECVRITVYKKETCRHQERVKEMMNDKEI